MAIIYSYCIDFLSFHADFYKIVLHAHIHFLVTEIIFNFFRFYNTWKISAKMDKKNDDRRDKES